MILLRNIHLWPVLFSLLILLLIPFAWVRIKQRNLLFWSKNKKEIHRRNQAVTREFLLSSMAVFLILLSLALALLRPSGNPRLQTTEQSGRDVVILLDVSRSMDAVDLYPSRLERAKYELIETLSMMTGDKVALMVFAGSSVLKCPLTTDHGFLRMALEEVNTSGSVSRGGSLVGDALRNVMTQVFNESSGKYKDILLITDGEDQESFPVEAARAVGDAGIRLLIIGLGSTQGSPIPQDDGGNLQYEGQVVQSSLDADLLRQMASVTPGGKYINVGTDSFALPQLYSRLISSQEKESNREESRYIYDEYYVTFLIPGLAGFIILFFLNLKRRGNIQ